ncbi:MAG: pilus assembly protein PilM [Clostridiales bacterium]|nr:pilus assembly protein PilM [Clostridiales bacterium]MCF8021156.1 pilus assembly protein PilM [Clostridiales bacterium]
MLNFNLKLLLNGYTRTAIDVGSSQLKVAQVKLIKGVPRVSYLYKIPVPGEMFEAGFNPEILTSLLLQVKENSNIKMQNVISCIRDSRVVTRCIKIPVMPYKELKKAVFWEAKKVIPLPLDNMVIDFAQLNYDSRESKQNILLGAAPASIVYDFHGAFKQVNFKLDALDLQALALWRVFTLILNNMPEVFAVADIGVSATHMIFIKKGNLKYTRSFNNGSTKLYMHPKSETSENAFSPGTKEIVKELHRSLEFYTEREKEPVQKLIITGSCSNINGFASYLSCELGFEVETGSLEQLSRNGEYIDPVFITAIGLAVREMITSAQN